MDRWTERLATTATNVDDGQYTADDAAGDLAATTSLAVQTGLQLVSGVIDAIAIFAPQKPVDASTPLLESPLAGAALTIEAPFVNLDASDTLFSEPDHHPTPGSSPPKRSISSSPRPPRAASPASTSGR